MKFLKVFFVFLLFQTLVLGQNMPELVGFSDGQASYLFLSRPIPANQGVVLWKKQSGGQWQKALNVIIRPIDDPYQMQKMLGSDFDILAKTMQNPDPSRILTKLKSDPVYSLMLCFKLPKLSMLLGRLIVDSRVMKNKTISYKVAFVNASGEALRETLAVKVKIRKPSVAEVKDLKINVSNRMADIHFSYPKFNWKKPDWVVGFRLYRSEDGSKYQRVGEDFIYRLDTPEISLQDGLLDYGKTYWYKITTVSYFGYESNGSTPVKYYVKDIEAPSIVQNIKAEFTGNGIMVSWDISSESDVIGYDIYRGITSDKVKEKLNKALIPVLQPFFLDSSGTEGEKYFYGIIAVDKAGNRSELSARPFAIWTDNTPPKAPASVNAKYAKGKIEIRWQPVKNEKLRGYYIYRGMDKERLVQITPKPVGLKYAFYADSGNGDKKFQYGKAYWVAVKAVDMSWNLSDYAYTQIILPDTIPPLPSSGVMVDVRKNGDVYFNWNPSPSSDVVQYTIQLYEEGVKEAVITKNTGIDTLNDVFPMLTKGKTYILLIYSIDRAGNKSIPPLKKEIDVRDYVPPSHPRNVFVEKTEKGYQLSWNKVYDFDFAGYRIYRSSSPMGTYKPALEKVIQKEEYILPADSPKGYYQVRALDSSGNESKKNEVVYIGK